MITKSVIISSFGLKNVVLSKYNDEEDFSFVFGEQEIPMNSFFAEFISPVVSRLHKTDPTINKINFGELNSNNDYKFKEFSKSILTSEMISLFQQISSGHSIELNEDQAIKFRFLSILLGNEELHHKLDELFPPKYSEENVNSYLKNIECCYHFSQFKPGFDFTSLLSFVSSHFDQLNKDDFLKLPRYLQHRIISNRDLRIESEDSLFDIIIEIIKRSKEKEEIGDVLFFEQLEFNGLSEDRLRTFVDFFDVNEMTGPLWNKLSECLFGRTLKKSNRTMNKCTPSIIVGGDDALSQLGRKPNIANKDGYMIISPPLKSTVDPTSLLSYSVFFYHSVIITRDGKMLGIGDNSKGCICSSLEKTQLTQFTEFSIEDDSNNKLTPISAVCTEIGTLYMLSKNNDSRKQLVYCDYEINGGDPIFLEIGDKQPVALFGGSENAAVICENGEIIFINRNSIKNSPESHIESTSLPDGEKASSVACCLDSIFVLSSSGRVFSSKINEGSNEIRLSEVEELADEEIVCLSGVGDHCLAVNKEGVVFGRGSNEHGQLGIKKETSVVLLFTEISSLREYEIKEVYAGGYHSLFVTPEGKILSCGYNNSGQLLLSSGPGENVYSPIETIIERNSTFCILGTYLCAVLIGSEPPANMPNRRIQQNQK